MPRQDRPRWRAILSGDTAERADEVLTNIAVALVPPAVDAVQTHLAQYDLTDDPSLLRGSAGIGVFFSYLATAFPGRGHERVASAYLDHSITRVEGGVASYGLMFGAAGTAWASEHVRSLFNQQSPDDEPGSIDEQLLEVIQETKTWRSRFDLFEGLIGLGVYALERPHSPASTELLRCAVRILDAIADRQDQGVAWSTDPVLTGDPQAAAYYDFGLANGVPGVVAFLAGVRRRLPDDTLCKTLLEDAVRWLLSRARHNPLESTFPLTTNPPYAGEPTPLAWCYGDLGTAAALVLAAKATADGHLLAEGVRIALKAASLNRVAPASERGNFSDEHGPLVDVGFCHGAAGIAHTFNRLFHYTGVEDFKNLALHWYDRTIAMRDPRRSLAGYITWLNSEWKPNPGLVRGVAGIGLALLASITEIEPRWDRVLLLSHASDIG